MSDTIELLRDLRARMPDMIADLRAKVADHASHLPPREAGYTIRNVGDESVIRIYDEIWWLGVNASDFVRDLDDVTAPKIRVEINSPGGDIFDGIAIYNALRAHPAEVTTRVDGMAASIASIIVQAGDRRIMLGGSQMMIHNASGLTIGDAKTHAEMVDILRQQDRVLAAIYAERSGRPADGFAVAMDAETWMTAAEAVEAGLADEVVEPRTPKNRTLHEEISDAIDVVSGVVAAAERVDALRAGAGKSLSAVNAESLAGLRSVIGRLDGLLTEEQDDDTVYNLYAEFVSLTRGVTS